VTATNSVGPSAPSAAASAYTGPTGLAALVVSGTQVNLTWNGGSGATYSVFRSTSGGAFSQVASGVTTTSWSSTGLKRNTTYAYYVVASLAPGVQSNTASAKTPKR
jgi:hypothetical protein